MKQTPQLEAIQRAMQPGAITAEGFLGADPRPLGDILIADEAAVRRLGLSHARIAGRMRELAAAGSRGLGLPTAVPPHFEVAVESVRGKLPCPFGHAGVYPKTNVVVRNLASGRQIVFTDLNIHLIAAHGFYEGLGSPFRCDPATLAEILEIAPEPPEAPAAAAGAL